MARKCSMVWKTAKQDSLPCSVFHSKGALHTRSTLYGCHEAGYPFDQGTQYHSLYWVFLWEVPAAHVDELDAGRLEV